MSLRRRVLLGCAVVAAVLLATDVVLASTFRSFLLDRIDRQLASAAPPVAAAPVAAPAPDDQVTVLRRRLPALNEDPQQVTLTEFFIGFADRQGRLQTRVESPLTDNLSEPDISPSLVVNNAVAPGPDISPFVATSSDGYAWRMASIDLKPQGGFLLIGVNLAEMETSYHRLLLVLAVATGVVLATLGLVAWWMLRHGVRPLTTMTATAEAIAEGTLSQRVPSDDEATEAGRLASALNAMLSRIEQAFSQREESDARLRRFVADASHELRTPLTSIRGYADLHRQGALTDPMRLGDAMRRIEAEADRMSGLVEDLLLLAHLDEDRPLQRAPVRMDELAEEVVADARAVDPTRTITLTVGPSVVLGDAARLRQALSNLVTNARVHTPATCGIDVAVAASNGHVTVTVADDGPGMSETDAARAFERFYRADPSRSRHQGGAGLGLAIVAGVLEAHGGEARVESAPGAGARFILTIPSAATTD